MRWRERENERMKEERNKVKLGENGKRVKEGMRRNIKNKKERERVCGRD